ncbi:MAG: hypothetical protein AB2693_21390 [Candidatus Thiodiazotropha sp.]
MSQKVSLMDDCSCNTPFALMLLHTSAISNKIDNSSVFDNFQEKKSNSAKMGTEALTGFEGSYPVYQFWHPGSLSSTCQPNIPVNASRERKK